MRETVNYVQERERETHTHRDRDCVCTSKTYILREIEHGALQVKRSHRLAR